MHFNYIYDTNFFENKTCDTYKWEQFVDSGLMDNTNAIMAAILES